MKLQKVNLNLSLFLCRNSISKIISVSESAIDQLPKFINQIPIVVYNGIDSNFYSLNSDRKYTNGKPQLFFIGNLFKYKNVQKLILAMHKIKKTFPEAHLQIAGDGNYRDELIHLIKKNKLKKSVELIGRITDEELKLRYSSCDIYVSASGFETFGLPLIEAMACGKPVLVSDIPAHHEIVDSSKAGKCFKDDEDYVDKIKDVYFNKTYSINARQFAMKNDWSEICKKMSKIYEQF